MRLKSLFGLCLLCRLVISQDPCIPSTDFGVAYDGTVVFSVLRANQTCSCMNYYTTGTGYFGDDITLSAAGQVNFANSLGQKIVLWSSSGSTYYGFSIASNTLEYRIPSTVERHSFYQGATEVVRIAGTGGVTITGTVDVAGAASFAATTVSGTASIGGTSSFTGLATFNGGLRVAAGSSTLSGNVAVSGATSFSTTTIGGTATHGSTSTFAGLATFSGGLTVSSGATALSGTLAVGGAATFATTVSAAGLSVTGGGGVSAGHATFGSLSVSGSSSLGSLSVGSALSASGLITAASGLSVPGGNVAVSGTAALNGGVTANSGMTSSGLLTANGGINIRAGTVFDFGVGASREVNAGKMGYGIFSGAGLDMVGAGTGARQINMWDNVRVQSNFVTAGTITSGSLVVQGVTTLGSTMYVNPAGGGLVLQRPSSGQGWSSTGRSNYETNLVNDYSGYNGLMIVGSGPGGSRIVQLWDRLQVNGDTTSTGLLSVTGPFTSSNTRVWRATDNRGGCPGSLCAGCAQIGLTISLSQASHVIIAATNTRQFSGRADLCLYVGGGEVNRAITYTPSNQRQSATVHWSGQLGAGNTYVYIADCSGYASIWGCGASYGSINVFVVG